MAPPHYDVVIIGSGFGGSMTAIPLAEAFRKRGKGERILMLERGTWWTTPVSTVQDKQVKTYTFLRDKNQPVQYWSSVGHMRGFVDIFTRCFRKKGVNEDGLYDLARLGRRKAFFLFGGENDGVTVLRANGVGGGSLVYSNITIRPPDFIFDDERWPISWTPGERHEYYEYAKEAIGIGILYALRKRTAEGETSTTASGRVTEFDSGRRLVIQSGSTTREFRLDGQSKIDKEMRIDSSVWVYFEPGAEPVRAREVAVQGPKINTGLSNIATRIAGLDPGWGKGPRRFPVGPDLDGDGMPDAEKAPAKLDKDPKGELWLDRAREFQMAASKVTSVYGTVDSSINDLPPGEVYDPKGSAKNFCQREGRCNVGCLPGARHTLNKQLMNAALGRPLHPEDPPVLGDQLRIQALAEVDTIHARPNGGYEVHYIVRDEKNNRRTSRHVVTARRVIVAAGSLGSTEILLRSKERGGLPNLSDRLGYGFSTNGDWIAFLPNTKRWMSLTRGPVTTSYAYFNTGAEGSGDGDTSKFHTVEDQGIPPALSAIAGAGVPLIRDLGRGRRSFFWIALKILRVAVKRFFSIFKNYREQQDFFRAEEELTGRMMCVVAQGREQARGQLRLGRGRRDTPLRVRRDDGIEFWDDPVYGEIRNTLDRMAPHFAATADDKFMNPFFQKSLDKVAPVSIATSHPLGGCRMARSAAEGVVDEYGRVWDKSRSGAVYDGLYVSDAAIIPTALAVNPSLTISALALRIADRIVADLDGSTAATMPTGSK